MKKYIFSVLMAAMAVFTFSSCEDVPAPYTMPEKLPDSAPEGTPAGTGTEADPYNCAGAAQYCKSLDGAESTIDVYVKGKVQSIEEPFSSSFGNCSVTLVDEGTNATFKIYRAKYFDNKNWTEGGKTLNIGDEVVFCGKVINYSGNTPETVQNKAYLVSINGEKGTGSDTPSVGEAKGTGTEADPFNSVAAYNEAVKLAAGSTTDQEYYIKGKLIEFVPGKSDTGEFNSSYGNASFMIADDETSTQFYIYRTYYFGGEKWKEGDTQLKVGDEVVVCSKLTNYNGTLETAQGGKLISINGKGGSVTPTPDPTPDAGDGMTATAITNNKQGTVVLTSNEYGEQKTDNEASWYTWTYDGVTYKAAKLCISAGTNGQGLQLQGNASSVTSQGFLFNATEFAKEIKTVTLYLSTKATATYAPSYSLYAAKAANGRDTKVTGTSTNATEGDWKTYTEVYDFSSYNTKFFTLFNNTTGALYIEKIVVTLK